MSEGTPKAIEPKGIVRNATKIGVQDGQAEDLINLRFMDGSWRASGNGMQIENMPTDTIYEQLYVHTNVYHHLLGVDNGVLYWFAEIDNDGVTFYPLDGTSDRSLWPEEMKDLPTERKPLTTVTGSMWITQTGHMLTIIDENDDFEFFVFKTGDKEYIAVNVDTNGKSDDRTFYPFGNIHFNYRSSVDSDSHTYSKTRDDQYVIPDGEDWNQDHSPACIPRPGETDHTAEKIWHAEMLEVFKKATDDNRFTSPFLVMAAVKLYDGTYAFASNPVLINPRENLSMDSGKTYLPRIMFLDNDGTNLSYHTGYGYMNSVNDVQQSSPISVYAASTSAFWLHSDIETPPGSKVSNTHDMKTEVRGIDLHVHIDNIDILRNNKDVFAGIGIFVTTQSSIFYNDATKGSVRLNCLTARTGDLRNAIICNVTYAPGRRQSSEIIYDLINSPFYLLRDYNIDELDALKNNNLVDIRSAAKYKNVLSNITAQKTLTYEAQSRMTYMPKVSYMYNGRLHIANYKSYPFFGFPIDAFYLHNHSVWPSSGNWYKNVLSNTTSNYDSVLQFEKDMILIEHIQSLEDANAPYFIMKVFIKSEQQGEQVVTRWLPAYNPEEAPAHTVNFIEDLNPILTYPDSRAYKMEIYYVIKNSIQALVKKGEFSLKPHPYLNMAYYIKQNLHPISLINDFEFSTYLFLGNNESNVDNINLPVDNENSLLPVSQIIPALYL